MPRGSGSNYDQRKDEEIASQEVAHSPYGHLKVAVFSYNKGERKIQLNRFKKGEGFAKLGRLTKQEFSEVARCVRAFIERGVL